MKKALTIMSWVEVIIGGLAILSSFSDENFYAFIGGALFLSAGLIALAYLKQK